MNETLLRRKKERIRVASQNYLLVVVYMLQGTRPIFIILSAVRSLLAGRSRGFKIRIEPAIVGSAGESLIWFLWNLDSFS